MFKNLRQIFTPKNKQLRQKILFTLIILFIFRIGTDIRVPGTESITSDLGFLELLNVLGGGALKKFSVFALGVMPYINVSIIIQILSMDIVPYFSNLAKEGNTGRQKINKITRYVGIAFAFVYAITYSYMFLGNDISLFEHIKISLILTAGTAFLLWLGDQITQKGIGNGISLIIMAGIVSRLPNMVTDAFNTFVEIGTAQSTTLGVVKFIIFLLFYIAIIVGVVFVQESERRIPIQYSNRTLSSYGAQQTYIPFRLNSASVMPVIFASSVVSIIVFLAKVIKSNSFALFVNKYLTYSSVTGFILYVVLIFLFTYMYTFAQLKPKELSDKLNKDGGYIPGIRPGTETRIYIKDILLKITFIGAIFLIIIAGLPIFISNFSALPASITLGGTGLLIVVGVSLETYRQIESTISANQYGKGYRRI